MSTVFPVAAAEVRIESTRDDHGRRPSLTLTNVFFYVVMLAWVIVSLGPLIWMVINSFRTNTEIFSAAIGSPSLSNTNNYSQAWSTADLGTALINSIIVSVGSVILSTICAFLIGFALSRGRLPFSGVIMTFFLLGLMIPTFSLLIPILLEFQSFGLISSRFGLILVYSGLHLSLGVFLFKGAFDTIANEYIEAAALDGCSVPRMLLVLFLPMMGPTVATFSILTFLSAYNDYVFALVLNNEPALQTLPVAILQFSGQYGTQYNLVFAAVTIGTIPPLIAYLFLRKQVQSSMAMGGRTG